MSYDYEEEQPASFEGDMVSPPMDKPTVQEDY